MTAHARLNLEPEPEQIKELYQNDLLFLSGKLYRIKGIEKSPYIMQQGVEMYIFHLEYVRDDLGEALADLSKI